MAPALADHPRAITRGRLVLLHLFGALAALRLCCECLPWQDSDNRRLAFDTNFIRTWVFAVPVCRAALPFHLSRKQQPIFALYHGSLVGRILSGPTVFVRGNEVR